ncbi:MAG: group II intron reverse transcriptase/maturase [Sphingobacteriia bacterium 35-40-5]|nr:MAG: group II intron reverse transcriptase/maturase [Sphingobacteriia bacterium 35-40-5]
MKEAKPFTISKHLVLEAWLKVKANDGAAGVDKETIEEFEADLKGNLYKIWNRMSSGSYMPPPVRLVEIPKKDGGIRTLGIPTVADRVAQMIVVMMIEPTLDKIYHPDSYGYRPSKSAHQAVEQARKRCWQYDWVLDLDIKAFFDSIDHELLMLGFKRHFNDRWIELYITRWLIVPYQTAKGESVERNKGVPQGSIIGPVLSNLFLHYAFDEWMKKHHPTIPFERYADDAICHCGSLQQANWLKEVLHERFKVCKLEMHEEKTKIVFCKRQGKTRKHEVIQFDFLGFTFRPRLAKTKEDKFFVSFLPAISKMAKKRISVTIRRWNLHLWTAKSLEYLADIINPRLQGWWNYYGKFYKSEMYRLFKRLNQRLAHWCMQKFRTLRYHKRRAWHYLGRLASEQPNLFVHWRIGLRPRKTYDDNHPDVAIK